MGLFDKMFGHEAEKAQQQPDAEKRFNDLKQKYQTVLTTGDQQHLQFQIILPKVLSMAIKKYLSVF